MNAEDRILHSYESEILLKLLACDSPTGFTKEIAELAKAEFEKFGFPVYLTKKGCVVCELGGEGHPLLISAHLDTLGGMVTHIKSNGRLALTALGGLLPNSIEGENCIIRTRFGKKYSGTMQLMNPSIHVNKKNPETPRTFDTMEVLLDEDVRNAEDTAALGVSPGDIVCFDPRTVITENGYIKSRFLDDKLSAAVLFGIAKRVSEGKIQLRRSVHLCLTVYEEVGHGCSAVVPDGTDEILCVDMGCIGENLGCTEKKVSICAKDSAGPYDYEMTTDLIRLAREYGIDHSVDVYPHYGSDADAALTAGADIRHALIGPGVYASHGYERSHLDGMKNTLRLIEAYLNR